MSIRSPGRRARGEARRVPHRGSSSAAAGDRARLRPRATARLRARRGRSRRSAPDPQLPRRPRHHPPRLGAGRSAGSRRSTTASARRSARAGGWSTSQGSPVPDLALRRPTPKLTRARRSRRRGPTPAPSGAGPAVARGTAAAPAAATEFAGDNSAPADDLHRLRRPAARLAGAGEEVLDPDLRLRDRRATRRGAAPREHGRVRHRPRLGLLPRPAAAQQLGHRHQPRLHRPRVAGVDGDDALRQQRPRLLRPARRRHRRRRATRSRRAAAATGTTR